MEKNIEFTLTSGEFMRLAESLHTILKNHRDNEDDIGLVTIKLDYETCGDPSLEVLVTEYDGNAEDPPLARYEVKQLCVRDDLSPLKKTDLRPN
jgi:hypothetical protein